MSHIGDYIDKVICGDAREILSKIPSDSIDLVITSPPYYKQRNYGEIGIGNEKTLEEYINNLLDVFRECVRIIKNTGTIVFNIGDKYENGSLLLIPWRFVIEAIKITNVKLINQVTWVKLNPTPRQDKKKLVPSTEPFFIFAKSNMYYFNKEAFLNYNEPLKSIRRKFTNSIGQRYFELIEQSSLTNEQKELAKAELLKAIREVKEGKIESFRMKIKGIHSMPYGGQEGGRKIQIERNGFTIIKIYGKPIKRDVIESPVETIKGNIHPAVFPEYIIQEFLKLLTKEGDIVLDPFIGSGTTGIVAKRMGRHFIGIEINEKYCEYARKRIAKTITDRTLNFLYEQK
ncbi:MAG: site-specific DNA-methyltransferase [Candidatus Hydrothermia bacterium]|jgi:site-specific DNA-methyltransferase (adenine-specific)|nr:site-specific DNA-methyltransferase [Candidatus Hydrothermia bacterium]